MSIESNTVFLRPIRFIIKPNGTPNRKNHTNTTEGISPAIVCDQPNAEAA